MSGEISTTLTMKNSVFWDITPCSLVKVNSHFLEVYHLHLQVRRKSHARSRHEADSKQSYLLHVGFFLGLLFSPEDGGDIFFQKIS
jgi:hypothetical protein